MESAMNDGPAFFPGKYLSDHGEGALGPRWCYSCRSRVGSKVEGLYVDRVLACNK